VTAEFKTRDAILVVLGPTALLRGALGLVFVGVRPTTSADLGARLLLAALLAALGLISTTTGFVRLTFTLPKTAWPSRPFCLAMIAIGGLMLWGSAGPFGWPQSYQPTDPRSQPGNVLAAVLAAAFGGSLLLVTGITLILSGARRRDSQ
jgi:hypothetical protein